MAEKRKDSLEEQLDEGRREFLEKAAKVGVAAPTAMFLVSAMNPQAALGYADPNPGGGGSGRHNGRHNGRR